MSEDIGAPGLAQYVIARREQLKLTQAQLADRAGVSRSVMNAVESGRVKLPGAEKRRPIAEALGVRHVDLLIAAGELSPVEIPAAGAPREDATLEDALRRFYPHLERDAIANIANAADLHARQWDAEAQKERHELIEFRAWRQAAEERAGYDKA